MHKGALLTIAIPTYNRCERLDLLLDSIAKQVDGVKKHLRVIVVNNASTDDTEKCVTKWEDLIGGLIYIRNEHNIGAVQNVIKCFDLVETKYCWIIGDDDIIRIGVFEKLLELLDAHEPDLVYMNNIGFGDKPAEEDKVFLGGVTPWKISGLNFGRMVNLYTTFISGMIVNKAAFAAARTKGEDQLKVDTLFPQLNWVLQNLREGNSFIYIPQQLILARTGASGGYEIYKSFSVDLVHMIDSSVGRALAKAIKRRTILFHLPGLILAARRKLIGDFSLASGDELYFRKAYARHVAYWILIEPILKSPIPVAMIFFKVSTLVSRLVMKADRLLVLATRKAG